MNKRGVWLVIGLFGALFFVLFGLLAVTASQTVNRGYRASSGRGIGVLEIDGEIKDSKKELKAIRNFDSEPSIKGVVVRIDSPGGAVAPSQEIYAELRKLGQTKKVVASFGSLAASGGYYIGLGANHIVSNPGTLTGSIGVIMQTVDASKLVALTKLDWTIYKSGTFKDMGSPLREPSAEERKLFADMIESVYAQFVRAIVESRNLPEDTVRKLADGRVMTGEQALEKKLVDQLGSFQTAIEWVADQAGIKGKPELIYPPTDDEDSFLIRLVREAGSSAIADVAAQLTSAKQLAPKYMLAP